MSVFSRMKSVDPYYKLLHDEILSLQGSHYILDPAGLNAHLGVTWPDLRKGQMPDSLFNYLREID